MRQSAGTLLYREGPDGLEVLLVHPSGPYNRKAPWSIPKGEPDEAETDLEKTARRETREETGVDPGRLELLGQIDYTKSKKRIQCFFGPAPEGQEPRGDDFEVAEARFVETGEARRLLHRDQQAFIDMLEARMRK